MRPSWDDYYMHMAQATGVRATCDRGRSGAILAVDNRQIFSGYVGAAKGLEHCDEVGHLIRTVQYEDGSVKSHCCRTVHAEVNAILAAAYQVTQGGVMYCRMEPCPMCAQVIINAGIRKVVAEYRYQGAELSRMWLRRAGVQLVVLRDQEPDYSRKS